MKVGFVNQVSFKSTVPNVQVQNPTVALVNDVAVQDTVDLSTEVKCFKQALEESKGKTLENLDSAGWVQEYDPDTDSISLNMFGVTDIPGYTIANDGSVTRGMAMYAPAREIIPANKELANYVKISRVELIKSLIAGRVSFGNAEDAKPTVTGAEAAPPANLLGGVENQDKVDVQPSKADEYKARLKDPEWEKKFVPEGNFIHMKKQNVIDGLEYEITPDGKVTEVGCWTKPTVILEDDEDSKKMFERNGLTDDKKSENVPKKKTTFNEKVANVWKFFAEAGKMVEATAKGLFYGALTGAALLSGAWMFRALPKAFTKEGPKLLEVIKHPLNHVGKAGKIIAGVGSALVLGYHLVAGRLQANQKTAVIDHKMKTGHRDV